MWWRHHAASVNGFGVIPVFEEVETRALMAVGVLSSFPVAQPFPTVTIITVTPTNSQLLNALKTFLTDLQAAFGPNGTGATAKVNDTLNADLAAIANLAGTSPSSTQAVQRLNNDVTAISNAGTITAPQKLTLLADLESIALGSGISGTQVISTANQVLGVSRLTLVNGLAPNDLTDPNAINSTPAGQNRGQDTAIPLALLSPGSSLSGSTLGAGGILGTNYRKLSDDLKAELAKAQAITSAQRAAIGRDFSEIARLSHRPGDELLKTLRDDLDAAVTGGMNAAARNQITADVQSVLKGAGLSDALINRTLADFQPVFDAKELSAGSIRTLLGDLANLLAARPKAAMPLGSWFLGK